MASIAHARQATPRPAQDRDRLDSYLEGLGTARLRTWMLERALASDDTDPRERETLAGRLADVYAKRLLTLDAPGEVQALDDKLDRLLRDYPKAETPGLQMLRIEGQFGRAEIQALRWIDEPDREEARKDALAIFDRIGPWLDRRRNELLADVARGNEALDRLDNTRRSGLERQVREASELAGRATYYAGWSSYYRSLMDPTADRAMADYQDARLSFRKLLDLTDDDEAPDIGTAAFDTPGLARVLLGLALSESARGREESAAAVFRLIRDPGTHASVRDWADYWEVWSHLRARRAVEARRSAQAAIGVLRPPASPAGLALCKALVRGGDVPETRAARLRLLGIRGLVRLGRLDLARAFLQADPIEPKAAEGVLNAWMTGQALLDQGEESKDPAVFEAAARAFRAGIGSAEAPNEPALTAACRLGLGVALVRLENHAEAVEPLRRAVDDLGRLGLPEVVSAEWALAFAQWRAARDADARAAALAGFRSFREAHPDHPNAAIVDDLIARHERELAAPQPTPGEPKLATIERCRELHRAWLRLPADARSISPQAVRLRDALASLASLPEGTIDGDARLEAAMMGIDVELARSPSDTALLRSRLGDVVDLVNRRPDDHPLATEGRLRQLRAAERLGDEPALGSAAEWLRDHGSRVEVVEAEIALARQADRLLAKAPDDPALLEAASVAYRALSERLGQSLPVLRKSASARAATLRRAELDARLGRPEAALPGWKALRAAFPDDPRYLEGEARALELAGQRDAALERWSILIAGHAPGSADWLAAKVAQLGCLEKLDRERARRALDQFVVLHPGPWPDAIDKEVSRLVRELAPPHSTTGR